MRGSSVYNEDVLRIADSHRGWDALEGTSILVTGATGMIGSVITDVLAVLRGRGLDIDVTALSRSEERLQEMFGQHVSDGFRLMAADVNSLDTDLAFDTVIHCASNTHPKQYAEDPVGTVRTNVIGLDNLLRTVSGSGRGRFVFLSSVEVYGRNRGDADSFSEDYCGYIDCNTVRAGYNESKRVGEALCQAYGSQYGVDFVIPRLSRCYGPSLRRNDTKAMSQFIRNGLNGEDIVLKSRGEQLFSYCYSADAADAVLYLLLNGKKGEAYNVAGKDSDVRLKDLASMIADLCGVDLRFELPDEAEARGYSTADRATLDISKIGNLGWSPSVSLKDGLSRTLSSFRDE